MKNAVSRISITHFKIYENVFMQLKHLIIFALVGLVLLLGFNIVNSNRHENNRAMAMNNHVSLEGNTAVINKDRASNSTGITNKPLGEQPKAIIDQSLTQIDDAKQADEKQWAKIDTAQ